MAKYFIEDTTLTNIADAIRAKDGTTEPILTEDMASRIEAIESGGSADPYEVARQIVDKTITEYVDSALTKIGDGAFNYCNKLTKLHAPNATEIGQIALRDCASLSDLDITSVVKIGHYAFSGTKLITEFISSNVRELGANPFGNNDNRATSSSYIAKVGFDNLEKIVAYSFGGSTQGQIPVRLKYIDCGSLATIPSRAFYNSYAEMIILRKSDGICTLANVDGFGNSYVAQGKGFIYVPKALLEEYKVATNCVTYANQFRAIEDYIDEIKLIYPNFVFGSEVA